MLPGEGLRAQFLPKLAERLQRAAGAERISPLFVKVRSLPRTEEIGQLKPTQESADIGQEFDRRAIHNGPGVQEIEDQMVAEKKKT